MLQPARGSVCGLRRWPWTRTKCGCRFLGGVFTRAGLKTFMTVLLMASWKEFYELLRARAGKWSQEVALDENEVVMPLLVLCVIPIVKGSAVLAILSPTHVLFLIREVNTCKELWALVAFSPVQA